MDHKFFLEVIFSAFVAIITVRIATRYAAQEWFKFKQRHFEKVMELSKREQNGYSTENSNTGGTNGSDTSCHRSATIVG